jgi:hypothetical protein
VFVFHAGPPGRVEAAAVASLQDLGIDGRGRANLTVQTADVAAGAPGSAAAAAVWKARPAGGAPTPWPAVRYPDAEEDSPPLRAAPLTPGEAAALTDSPVRRELVRRIASGESVVWLLLESGDRAGDDRAAEVLTAELRALERELRLPAGIGEAGSRLHSDLPLRIAFSVLRMSRTDPAER